MAAGKKLFQMRLVFFLTVGLLMVLQACDPGEAARERENMNSDPKSDAGKPPIDLAAPVRVGTATFALG